MNKEYIAKKLIELRKKGVKIIFSKIIKIHTDNRTPFINITNESITIIIYPNSTMSDISCAISQVELHLNKFNPEVIWLEKNVFTKSEIRTKKIKEINEEE